MKEIDNFKEEILVQYSLVSNLHEMIKEMEIKINMDGEIEDQKPVIKNLIEYYFNQRKYRLTNYNVHMNEKEIILWTELLDKFS